MSIALKEQETFENLDIKDRDFYLYDFAGCKFFNCTFTNCKFNSCSFSTCEFNNCKIINSKFTNSRAKFLSFNESTLFGINWTMLTTNVGYRNPLNSIHKCVLKYNYFTQMNLIKFNFDESTIINTEFDHCELSSASFKYCDLTASTFTNSSLTRANFKNARGYMIDIRTCSVAKATFSYPDVTNLLVSLDINIE